ncbi:MAG: aspartate aminotransferase family protein [Candidatus Portnoybacteria bacterium]|nr:aspartate aminotransferase family protein [Candidatus Portnoybacteria bacterium]MDD4982849.1 aspartate aminotransferase family protein [Candidatus Portnoybacteria bacterium]
MKTKPKKESYLYPCNLPGLKIVRTDDVYLYDENNKKYVDLSASAGVVAVGYNSHRMKEVMRRQAEKNIFSPQLQETSESILLAKKILGLFPAGFDSVLRATTGSEAVEIAMKIAARQTGRSKFLSFKGAYHGHTFAAMSLGGENRLTKEFTPILARFATIKHPSSLNKGRALPADFKKTLKSIEKELKRGGCAGFVAEGVVTSAGCFNFPDGFFKEVLKMCRRYGTLLIFDEVLTGFGRTGKMFSFEHFSICPDMVCLAKGLGSGYAPISAVVSRKELIGNFVYMSTFAWSPLACAVALENINIIEEEKLAKNSCDLGRLTLGFLKKSLSKNKAVKEIRGKGLIIAIEFFNNNDARKIFNDCLKKGVLLFKNYSDNMLFVQPPLNIRKNILNKALGTVIGSINENFG